MRKLDLSALKATWRRVSPAYWTSRFVQAKYWL